MNDLQEFAARDCALWNHGGCFVIQAIFRVAAAYTLASEPGDSLRGAGWKVTREVKAESWNRAGRPRIDTAPLQKKLRWEVFDG